MFTVMDKATEQGYSSEYVAQKVLKAVLRKEKDVIIAPIAPKCAILIRSLFPSFYFWLMKKRARKLAKVD